MGWNLGTSNPNEVGVTWNQGNPTTGNVPNTAREQAIWEQIMAQRAAQAQAQIGAQEMQHRMQAPLGPQVRTGILPAEFGAQYDTPTPVQGGYDPTVPGLNWTFPGAF